MSSIDKQVTATIRKKKVNQLARSIRKKYLGLKLGKSENDQTLNKLFRPVVEPLEKIIKNQTQPASKQNQLSPNPITVAAAIATAASKKPVKSLQSQINPTPPTTTTDGDEDDDDELYEDAKVVDEAQTLPPSLENIMNSENDEFDKIYGPRYNRDTSTWKMGSKIITFDKHGNILIDEKKYKGTPGLHQLIFYKEPVYEKTDLATYKELLEGTGVHLNSIGNLKSSKQHKYLKIIKPLVHRPRLPSSSSASGSGLGLSVDKMIFNRRPIEYRYWDDPNELCERLKLLIAAKEAGNNSVQNEIVAIINELKEADIIRNK